MSVNYTPDYESINGNLKTLKPFRFWCQKVLPLVYDDSLSYYELLNKVVQYLNDTMEDVDGLNDNVNTLDDNVRAIYQAYNQLQDYVNNYFDNLDVQNEINNKLDVMATDGTLSALISTIATPMIPGLVSDWLEENVEPTTPVVDSSLSITGAAADAKVTGDKIAELNNDIDEYQNNIKLVGNLITELIVGEYPNYNSSGVIIETDSNRAYAKIKVKPNHTYSFSDLISGNFSFWAYESGGVEYGISKINSFATQYVATAPSNATLLYISNSGWNANTDIVVMETDISIYGAHRSDYPFDEVVKIEAEKLTDLYNTIDVLGVEKYSKWERGDLEYSDSSAVPTKSANWTYTEQRICTPISEPISLNAGDTLSINDAQDIVFYPSYYAESTWHTAGWISSDFIAPIDGNYWLTIRHATNATLNGMNELADVFTITRVNGIISNTWKIPQYYYDNEYLANKVNTIKNKNEILNGVNFVFITDLHFAVNQGKSKYLINYIRKHTSLDIVICGGDFARVYGSMVQLGYDYNDTLEFMNTIGKDCFYGIRGNHDFYDKLSASSEYSNMYTWAKTYNAIYRNSEPNVRNALVQHGAYCIDNDSQKTRFICLNSSDWNLTYDKKEEGVPYISVEQATWFIEQLEEKNGWNIIVISHIPSAQSLSSNYDSQSIIQDILESFKSRTNFSTTYKSVTLTGNFANTTNSLICHISGHEHYDGSSVDSGVLSIVTTCDALYQDDGYGGVAGTVTEQAFDVFSINYDTGKINATRIGRGSDREWSY